MNLITSFAVLLQPLAIVMTAPSYANLVTVLTGWVFAPRRTITGMLGAAGAVGRKHHSAFHRLFASAQWSLDGMGLAVFRLIEPHLDGEILLAVDDTLCRKRGSKVFGAGMHHDPLLSSRKKAVVNWGHSWVVLSVIVRFPLWPDRPFALPVLFRLYLNKHSAPRHRRAYRTRPQLAVEMLQLLCRQRKLRQFHLIADSAYGGQSVLNELPANCHLTSRLLIDARLYASAPKRQPGQKGRPRKRGERLPSPEAMLQQRARRADLSIYGRQDRVRLADAQAYVHAAPDRLLRVVAVEPLTGSRPRQAFYSTCFEATAEQVLAWYAWRWSLEVTFHDSKQHLGFEQPQGWTRRAVERTAPMAMLLYSLIVLWFVAEGHRRYRAPRRPWYPAKSRASFPDMLATLRRESLREKIFAHLPDTHGCRKIQRILENTMTLAA